MVNCVYSHRCGVFEETLELSERVSVEVLEAQRQEGRAHLMKGVRERFHERWIEREKEKEATYKLRLLYEFATSFSSRTERVALTASSDLCLIELNIFF